MKTKTILKIPHFVVSESTGKYKSRRALTEEQIIRASYSIIKRRVSTGVELSDWQTVGLYLVDKLAHLEQEVFVCLFLDNQHRLIKFEEMFKGTIDCASVYPREVVKRGLQLNAGAVIFAHNHPSGNAKPSLADKQLTNKLKQALSLVEIRTLDHFIVGGGVPYSFAGNGLID